MTATPAQVAAVLEAAPALLHRVGWRQGPRAPQDVLAGRWPGLRVGDALWHAALDAKLAEPFDAVIDAASALAEWIGEHPDAGPVSWQDPETLAVDVDAWQDAPDRTVRDVVRACRGAARLVWPQRYRIPTAAALVAGGTR